MRSYLLDFSKTDYYLFVGSQAYDGMIVGEHSRDTDLDVREDFVPVQHSYFVYRCLTFLQLLSYFR